MAHALASELRTNVVLTLGRYGIAFCSRNGSHQFAMPTLAREVFDVSGAGDTVVAAFALARASGADDAAAVTLANRAASIVVGKFGTATVTADEILQDTDVLRLVPRRALEQLATTLRARGKRIAAISGTFDVLSDGHRYVLNDLQPLGEAMIVGINIDESVSGGKTLKQPVVPEQMLLALRMVDCDQICHEPDSTAVLDKVTPPVRVNGSAHAEARSAPSIVFQNVDVVSR
jgi:D-beta-D-heptose 7-phosphate kinase/D-beta-D-heptose 1-phosphate adenosyltransferase